MQISTKQQENTRNELAIKLKDIDICLIDSLADSEYTRANQDESWSKTVWSSAGV